MELFLQVGRLHGLFPGLHFVRISPDGIDLPVVDDEPVGVRPLPAGVGVGAKPGMDGGNGRFIVWILKISEEGAKLSYQEHAFVHNGPAGHGDHIGVVVALLEHPSCNIKLPVKIQSLLHLLRLFDKSLLDIRHTFPSFVAQDLRMDRDLTESQKFHSFFLHDDLKHFFRLVAFQLFLREKQLCDPVLSFFSQLDICLFADFGKEFMGDLKQNPHTVAGFPFCVFSRPVLQVLHNVERPLHRQMAFDPPAVHHGADPAVVMFKCGTIESLLLFSHTWSLLAFFSFP